MEEAATGPSAPPGTEEVPAGVARATGASPKQPNRRSGVLLAVGVAVIVIVVVAVVGYSVYERSHAKPSTTATSKTLLPADELISISPEQYYGVEFIVNSTGVLNTTYSSIYPTPFYIMTPHEYYVLIYNYTVIGYEWTFTTTGNSAVQYLSLGVTAGEWWFAMANPSPINTTAVGFLTALTLTTG